MSVMSVGEGFLANTSRNDLAGAIVAGFVAGVVRSLIAALYRDLSLWAYVRWIVVGLAAYFFVALLLQRFWRDRLAPNWVLTSFFGSVLFVAALLGPAVITGWYDPYNVHLSFMDYFLPELDAAGRGVMLLHLVTLPITAVFHYAREIVGATKKWHAGSGPTSILRGE